MSPPSEPGAISLPDLLWYLEESSIRVSRKADGGLNVGPASLLTPRLTGAIKAHRDTLAMLALRAEMDVLAAQAGERPTGDGTLIGALREWDGLVPQDWKPPLREDVLG